MRLVPRLAKGGPADGATFNLIEDVRGYRVQCIAHVKGELVHQFHVYRLGKCGNFIYKGVEE